MPGLLPTLALLALASCTAATAPSGTVHGRVAEPCGTRAAPDTVYVWSVDGARARAVSGTVTEFTAESLILCTDTALLWLTPKGVAHVGFGAPERGRNWKEVRSLYWEGTPAPVRMVQALPVIGGVLAPIEGLSSWPASLIAITVLLTASWFGASALYRGTVLLGHQQAMERARLRAELARAAGDGHDATGATAQLVPEPPPFGVVASQWLLPWGRPKLGPTISWSKLYFGLLVAVAFLYFVVVVGLVVDLVRSAELQLTWVYWITTGMLTLAFLLVAVRVGFRALAVFCLKPTKFVKPPASEVNEGSGAVEGDTAGAARPSRRRENS